MVIYDQIIKHRFKILATEPELEAPTMYVHMLIENQQ